MLFQISLFPQIENCLPDNRHTIITGARQVGKASLLRFTPRAVIDSRARHRTMAPEEEYKNGHILTSESCKKLQDAGVNINLGAHGQLQGLGAHWELWMLQQGGMSNMQALRSATLNGAVYLGMDKEQRRYADDLAEPDQQHRCYAQRQRRLFRGRRLDQQRHVYGGHLYGYLCGFAKQQRHLRR